MNQRERSLHAIDATIAWRCRFLTDSTEAFAAAYSRRRTGANEQIATRAQRLRSGQLATETAAKAEAQASAEERPSARSAEGLGPTSRRARRPQTIRQARDTLKAERACTARLDGTRR